MAARANPFFDIASPPPETAVAAAEPYDAIARLAQMHGEAVETARLANLLGRSLHAAIALPVLAVLTVLIGGGAGLPSTISWAIMVAVATFAVLRVYGHGIRQPFERSALHAFAQDLNACLLYAGFAWGAGAFLALADGASGGTALLFCGVPAVAVAVLLRERQAVLLFLAPVAALTSLACVVRPLGGGALAAALVLIACAIVAAAVIAAARHGAARREADLPHALFAS
ncbi:MAG TPA: hypothetical protein VNU97_14755 [Rhizomicrobium sp.]|jgi:hypothetical protein|nr:hypothetical protein [Rhizomicrobium sp.]